MIDIYVPFPPLNNDYPKNVKNQIDSETMLTIMQVKDKWHREVLSNYNEKISATLLIII